MENQKNTIEGSDIKVGGDYHHGDKNTTINNHHYAASETKQPKELCAKLPSLHADDIIGREKELQDVHNLLFDNKHVVVVNGLGGIGKTTLAQGYLNKYQGDYHHILWVSQLSDDVTNDFVNTEGLTQCLGIDTQGKEVQQIFLDLITQLKNLPNHPNLLIIDNADAALSKIHDLLPHQPDWHLLVTSRERIEKFHSKDLSFLSPDHALELFRKHCTRIQDEQQIRELLETVDYHTLTIEILAKTAQLQRSTVADLKKAIADDLKANVYVAHLGDKVGKVFSYLSSIFQLSKLTPNETWLAKQFICLPPVFHKYDLLLELINPAASEKADIFSETLTALADKGWLLSDGDSDSYKMHRIVVEVAARQIPMEVEEVGVLVHSIAKKMNLDQAKDNPVDKFAWIPFGQGILEQLPESDASIVATLQSNLASALQDLGDYTGAKILLEKAVQSDEKNFGPNHPETASKYSNLGLVLEDLGEYTEAKRLLEKAVESDENNFGYDHPTTTNSYSNLALVLQSLGEYSRAKTLQKKAVQSDEKNLGPDHPSMAIRYSNLATVLQNLGEYAEAKVLLQKAVQSDEKNFGPDHPYTAQRYSNLAIVLRDLGEYVEAKILLQKAIQSDEKNFGPDHPSMAVRYSNLATVFQALGDYTEAKRLLEKALQSSEKNLGSDHPSMSTRYSNLATVLQNLGDYTEAKNLLEKAIQSDERNLGSDHPYTAISYSNLALVLENLNDYGLALVYSRKAIAVFQKVLPTTHPYMARTIEIYESIKSKLQP